MHKFDVYGVCNPLVDLLSHVPDSFLKKLGIEKNVMHLVKREQQQEMLLCLAEEKIALEVKGKVVGDSSVQITSVDDIDEASEGSITFSFLPKFQKKMSSSKASAFVSDSEKGLAGYNCIVVEQPYLAMINF